MIGLGLFEEDNVDDERNGWDEAVADASTPGFPGMGTIPGVVKEWRVLIMSTRHEEKENDVFSSSSPERKNHMSYLRKEKVEERGIMRFRRRMIGKSSHDWDDRGINGS